MRRDRATWAGALLRPGKRRWRVVISLGVAGAFPAFLIAGCLVTCRPGWYQPASIDYARLKADKRDLVNTLDEIGAALNRGRPIDLELHEAQVNRWITARSEMWPDVDAALIEPLQRPQILFLDDDRLRLATTIERAGVEFVFSCVCRAELRNEGLVVAWESIRLGALPVPVRSALNDIGEVLGLEKQGLGILSGATLTAPNDWTWPNGKRRFRIRRLTITPGVMRVSLEPL